MDRQSQQLFDEFCRANFSYNPETGDFARNYLTRRPVGYRRGRYSALTIQNKRVHAHHLAWFLHYGEWPSKQMDHINRDPLDNRIANLRLADAYENRCNQGLRGSNCTGFKGVKRSRAKWTARITVSGQKMHLGTFDTPTAAAGAYDAAALRLHGPFALTNASLGLVEAPR